ncbi:hypothetical protein FB470_005484 [Amycolatopsis thermophila]|uniref:Uncharacterized protein n=1 Tax=Amycolatopsis thermophila TaxID=206084 RepID=A0ABU0F329_9PSEU|nr:hypothetical protein [Amycolatopsis thermophila]
MEDVVPLIWAGVDIGEEHHPCVGPGQELAAAMVERLAKG